MKIAFIGLGIMGSRMASHLLENEVDLTVYNRSEEAMKPLKEKGAKTANSANEAVKEADIVFSMLSKPEAVEEVFFGKEGALASMKKDAIWADCSTVNPSFSLKAFEEAKKHNIKFLDTPVSGSKPQAQAAELIFLVGGEKTEVETLEPYLNMMSKKVLHIGNTGKGASFKIIVNMMLAQSMLIFSEATLLGQKMGIEKEFLLETLPNLIVAAPFTKVKAENIKKDNYDVQFPLEWMLKDLQLASITAYENKQPLYLSNLAKEIYTEANRSGMSRMDFSAIHKYLEEKA